MDGVFIYKLKQELKRELKGAFIHKVYQPHSQVFNLVFRGKGTEHLNIFVHPNHQGIFMGEIKLKNPLTPPPLAMLMRKYLHGLTLKDITQPGLERLLTFDFGKIQLTIELMGRHANLALLKDNQVLGVLKHQGEDSVRPISSGYSYTPPPKQEKHSLKSFSINILREERNEKIWRAIFNNIDGMGPKTARELCAKAKIDPDTWVEDLEEKAWERIQSKIEWLKEFLEKDDVDPTALFDGNKLFAIFPFRSENWPHLEITSYPTLSELLEKTVTREWEKNRLQQKKNHLQKLIRKEKKKKDRKLYKLNDELREAQGSEKLKIKGELLTAFAHQIQKGLEEVELPNYYEENKPVSIKLKPNLSPHENAQQYFKKYNKKKKAKRHLKRQLALTRRDYNYLEDLNHFLEESKNLQEVSELEEELKDMGLVTKRKQSKRESRIPPLQFQTSDGRTIFVGRNNRQNEDLFRKGKDHDIWLHARKIPGSHVLIKTQGKEVTEDDIQFAAQLAAYYSRSRQDSKVEVDYTTLKNVRKPKGSPLGYVHYENYSTLRVNPKKEKGMD